MDKSQTEQKHVRTNASSRSKIPLLKLTILNLSGINIRRNTESSSNNGNATFDNLGTSLDSYISQCFSISASVAFTGSCDSNNMRVVSSALCSTSGQLFVESRPVVVPAGITDGLIAAWDDSSATLTIPRDHSLYYDNVLEQRKGSIMAIPRALPHLFVKLDEHRCASPTKKLFSTREMMKLESCAGLSTVSSLSEGPDFDHSDLKTLTEEGRDKNDDLKLRSILRENDDISKCCTTTIETVDETTDLSDRSKSNLGDYHESSHLQDSIIDKNNLTVINMPSQSDESASIPEILEMQISLRIDQVPHQNEEEEYLENERVTVKSACLPCNEGGSAVAHLVLFNDFLLNVKEEGFRENGGDVEGIVVLPVRKHPSSLNRGVSSISGVSSKSGRNSNATGSKQARSPFSCKDEILVDLEDDATISVRLERCASEDDPFLNKDIDEDAGVHKDPIISSLKATEKVDSCHQIPSHDQGTFERADFVKNSQIFKEDYLSRNHVYISGGYVNGIIRNHDDNDTLSDKAQPDLAESCVDGKDHQNECKKKPNALHKSSFHFERILGALTNLVSHCGDDVQGYDINGVMSMDSTIYTSGSL